MISSTIPSNAGSLTREYLEFDRSLRLRQARVAGILALLLMPAGLTLDYFVYPTLIRSLLELRLGFDLAMIPLVALLFTQLGRRNVYLLDKSAAILSTICMCFMIFASEGTVSPYYAGLNLVITAVCLLFPYSMLEGAGVCAFVLLSYTVACLVHQFSHRSASGHAGMVSDAATLYNNIYFLGLTSVIAVTACRLSSRRRFEDFRLRHELAVNNNELSSTLKKLKETEVQLVQSEKMNALGKLSAGLLHEVNNPLNFTFMALQMAEQEAEGNESLQDTLKDIGQGMGRIRGVISDLRAFAHPSAEAALQPFPLDEALTTAMRLTAHELGDIAVVHKDLASVKALGAQTQIVHVFMNMLVNAAHATKKMKRAHPQITCSCTVDGDRVRVAVRDNGSGVKAADLPRLLEPFFTTKDVGEGMGLGLSICHTIIKNHGGEIRIATEEGQWTEVSFDLPAENVGVRPSLDGSTPAFAESSLEAAGSIA